MRAITSAPLHIPEMLDVVETGRPILVTKAWLRTKGVPSFEIRGKNGGSNLNSSRGGYPALCSRNISWVRKDLRGGEKE